MMPEVFLYNIAPAKAIKIKNLCRRLYVGAREIDPADYGVPLSALLGLTDDRSAQPVAAFTEEMLYFVGFNGGFLSLFLDSLRRAHAPVTLKAVMTDENVGFTSYELAQELKAEHAALNPSEKR